MDILRYLLYTGTVYDITFRMDMTGLYMEDITTNSYQKVSLDIKIASLHSKFYIKKSIYGISHPIPCRFINHASLCIINSPGGDCGTYNRCVELTLDENVLWSSALYNAVASVNAIPENICLW